MKKSITTQKMVAGEQCSSFSFRFKHVCIKILSVSVFVMFLPQLAASQQLDVPYVPTPMSVVEKMLDVTNTGPGDYVIDLGSGDGRIVIAAAKRGALGHGIDLDPRRVSEAEENAIKDGVADKVMFIEGDLFEADFSRANVVTMYLLSTVNLKLRPYLLENLRPGSRIVSHDFNMGDWQPDEHIRVDNRDVYYWVIPARVEGRWQWNSGGNSYSMNIGQKYQELDVDLRAGNRRLNTSNTVLAGERISFTAVNPSNGNRYVYSGRVDGKNITGIVQIRNGNRRIVENWSAILN